MFKVLHWNIDGLGWRSRELRALIADYKPSVVVLNRTKYLTIRLLQDARAGEEVEEVLALQKSGVQH